MNKALRRNLMLREKVRAKKFLRDVWHIDQSELTAVHVGRRARTRRPCSCYMCQHLTRRPVVAND
jgi:hypothetical protein